MPGYGLPPQPGQIPNQANLFPPGMQPPVWQQQQPQQQQPGFDPYAAQRIHAQMGRHPPAAAMQAPPLVQQPYGNGMSPPPPPPPPPPSSAEPKRLLRRGEELVGSLAPSPSPAQ